jgi:hypothetical protein
MLDHLESLHSLPSNPHSAPEAVGGREAIRQPETVVGALTIDPNRIALDAVEFAKLHGRWDPRIIEEFGDGNWSALTQKPSGPEFSGVDNTAESGQ